MCSKVPIIREVTDDSSINISIIDERTAKLLGYSFFVLGDFLALRGMDPGVLSFWQLSSFKFLVVTLDHSDTQPQPSQTRPASH